MANIREALDNFKNARYGEQIRDSLVEAVEAINDEVEKNTTDYELLQTEMAEKADAIQNVADEAERTASIANETASNAEKTANEAKTTADSKVKVVWVAKGESIPTTAEANSLCFRIL